MQRVILKVSDLFGREISSEELANQAQRALRESFDQLYKDAMGKVDHPMSMDDFMRVLNGATALALSFYKSHPNAFDACYVREKASQTYRALVEIKKRGAETLAYSYSDIGRLADIHPSVDAYSLDW